MGNNTIYLTITQMEPDYLRSGKILALKKDHESQFDDESIAIYDRDARLGYVANSIDTVACGTFLAGCLCDRIWKRKIARFCLSCRIVPLNQSYSGYRLGMSMRMGAWAYANKCRILLPAQKKGELIWRSFFRKLQPSEVRVEISR